MLRTSAICVFGLVLFSFSCQKVQEKYSYDIPLNSAWEFRMTGDKNWLPANVPGSLISDLLKNNKVENSFFYNNPSQLAWLAKADWEYRTTFDADPEILTNDSIQLYFQGLDDFSDVYLNDSLILKANYAFGSWKINCKSLLKETDNHLRVYFHSHLKKEIRKQKKLIGCNSVNYSYNNCNFFIPSGLCHPIHLQAWSIAKITDLYIRPKLITKQSASYSAEFVLSSTQDQDVVVELLINNKLERSHSLSLKKGNTKQQISFAIKDPTFWWTNGLGDPYLYDLSIRVKKEQGIIHDLHQHLGVRTIEFVHTDSIGEHFALKLNNTQFFIKGTCYYPSDVYPNYCQPESFKQVLGDVQSSNFNMLVMSGGGIYEDDQFYDLCDKLGILVWQNFILNGAELSIDTTGFEKIRQTATENVKRLRNHPCLSLWFGSEMFNQDSIKHYSKNIEAQLKKNYHKLFNQLLPEVVNEYNDQTAYRTAIGSNVDENVASDTIPVLFDTNKSEKYLVLENGPKSLPSLKTIRTFIQMPLKANRQDFLLKQNIINTDNILKSISQAYKIPEDFESFVYLSQLVQADAMKTAIDRCRLKPQNCSGIIFGQLNDFKPDISYSTIDYYGRWKLAHYSISDAFSHIRVIPVRESGFVKIYAVSEAQKDMDAILLAKLMNFKGQTLYVKQIPVDLKANNSCLLLSVKESEILKQADKSQCCLIVQLNQPSLTLSQNILYFTEPKNLVLSKNKINLDVSSASNGFTLILKSGMLAKNVCLETLTKESFFSDNNFDLLPDKRIKVTVQYAGTKEEFVKDLKIRSLADIE
jgi:beta-mannosidase